MINSHIAIGLAPTGGPGLATPQSQGGAMLAQFPKEQETKREVLLARVESIAPILQASGGKSEELATLAPEAVAALRDNGLFKLKLPAVVGGSEADPVTEMLVLEAIAYHDFTSGWCT